MRRCFYHTDLRQNEVFQNFSRQIALIQFSEPYEARVGFWKNRSKNFQNLLYGQLVLTFDQAPKIRASCRVFERTCLELDLRFNLIKILLICSDFKVFVRLVHAAF